MLIQRPYAISCMATGGEWVHVPLEADIGGRMDPVFYMQHDHVAPTHRVSESLPRIETLTLTPALPNRSLTLAITLTLTLSPT